MKIGLYFSAEDGASSKNLPGLKSPQEFEELPGKGETILVETKDGKKISAIIREIHGHRTGISLGIFPTNGVGKDN